MPRDDFKMLLQSVVGILLFAITAANEVPKLCSSPMTISSGSNIIIIQNISETSPPNTVLKRLDIVGNDSQIILLMVTANDYVRFNSPSRELIVIKSFNVTGGTPMYMNLNFTCTTSSMSIILQVVLQIYDMNNNPPSFINLPYSVNVTERTAVNSTVFDGVEAVDPDPCDKGYLIYSVVDSADALSSYFSFPVSTVGNLKLMRSLDYEKIQRFNLTITVRDNGNNITILGQYQSQFTATTSIVINVSPADDYNPVFNQSSYAGIVAFNSRNERIVSISPPISASIKYSWPWESLVYSIVPDRNVDVSGFTIDNETGIISASSLLSDSPSIADDTVAFQIQATKVNQSYRYGTALVRLNVMLNTKPFSFTQRLYSGIVDNDAPNGTIAATVTTVNWRSRPVYYFNGVVKDFIIDPDSGEIQTIGRLNYKSTPLYNFTVSANDSTNTDTCRVTLTVVKLNRSNPQFAQNVYNFNISTTSSFVGQITATDDDQYASLTYRLIDTSGVFGVDNSGRIQCACSSAGFLANVSVSGNSYSMMLIVEDDVSPKRQGSALVVVTWATPGKPEKPTEGQLCAGETNWASNKAYYIATIVLGVATGILLLLVIILVVCLYRRSKSRGDPQPRVTIEVSRTPQKPHSISSQGSRRADGFEVTKDLGPYLAYGSGDAANDVITHSSSVLNSTDKLQKLKIYHSVPTHRPDSSNRNDIADARAISQLSTVSRKQPLYPPYPINSSSTVTTSSPPSSRVERYQFEDEPEPRLVASLRGPKSAAARSMQGVQSEAAMSPGFHSVPGPRRGSRFQSTVAALRESNSGETTSSTETLMAPIAARGKSSNVSFVENSAGYVSSQEGMDVSMSALTRQDGDTGITVYY